MMYELPSEYAAPTWPSRLGTVAGVLLGLVLLVAVWGKALDPVAFAEQIRFEGLDLLLSAEQMALFALAVEFALGLSLVLGIRRLTNLVPTLAVVLLFLFLTGRGYWRFEHGLIDGTEACGCFGNLVDRSPAEAFWQDLGLLVPLMLLSFIGYQRRSVRRPWKRLVAVIGLTAAVVVFAHRAPELPLDDLATRLRPGVVLSDLCAGAEDDENRICLDGLLPDLDQGRHLVVLVDLQDEVFLDAVDVLSDRATSADDPGLVVVTVATTEEVRMFAWQWAPSFEIREAPAALLRPLYRRLPRSFEVVDGRVVRTYSGLPPA